MIDKNLCDYDLQLLLAEQFLLQGDVTNAKSILYPLNEQLSSKSKTDIRYFAYLQALMGWLSFLEEDFTAALSYFEQHKLLKNKLTRRKRQYVGGVAGIFYLFTLLKLGHEGSRHYFTLVIEQHFNYETDNNSFQQNAHSYRTLSSCAEVFVGKKSH